MTDDHLPADTRALVRLSAVLASRDEPALRAALGEAAAKASPEEVEETLLQSYLFLGYPIALNAFALWREATKRPTPPPVADGWSGWVDRGETVCRTVYGGQYQRLRENVRDLHPDMERWMVAEGYGKVLGRPGIDLKTRELSILALLAVLGAPRQLYSHIRGALNAGATRGAVREALDLALTVADPARAQEAGQVWDRLSDRTVSSTGTSASDPTVTAPPHTGE